MTTPLQDVQLLDGLIEQFRPQLRQMLAAAISLQQPFAMVPVGKAPLPSGQQWDIFVAVLIEPFACVAQGALVHGMGSALESYAKLNPAAPQGGFDVPVG